MTDQDNTRHQLYRHFNSKGGLLYVGISLSAVSRLAQHKSNSVWYDKIARIEIENYPSRELLDEAETIAIKSERPEYNKHKIARRDTAPSASRYSAELKKIKDSGNYKIEFDGVVYEVQSSASAIDYISYDVDAFFIRAEYVKENGWEKYCLSSEMYDLPPSNIPDHYRLIQWFNGCETSEDIHIFIDHFIESLLEMKRMNCIDLPNPRWRWSV